MSRPNKTRQNGSHVAEAEMERSLGFGLGNTRWEITRFTRPIILVKTLLVLISAPRSQARVVAETVNRLEANGRLPIKSTVRKPRWGRPEDV